MKHLVINLYIDNSIIGKVLRMFAVERYSAVSFSVFSNTSGRELIATKMYGDIGAIAEFESIKLTLMDQNHISFAEKVYRRLFIDHVRPTNEPIDINKIIIDLSILHYMVVNDGHEFPICIGYIEEVSKLNNLSRKTKNFLYSLKRYIEYTNLPKH